jgi:ABC-type multidrug transport system ATPase subunit
MLWKAIRRREVLESDERVLLGGRSRYPSQRGSDRGRRKRSENQEFGDDTSLCRSIGITLSGGQRQRLNIARAIYFGSDIVILDDPLSALDAHVGKAVFQNVIVGGLAGRTRILVTHALHFLPLVDRILVIDNGKIAEDGTYSELVKAGGAFSHLVSQFGAQDDAEKDKEDEPEEEEVQDVKQKRRKMIQGAQQMQTEERSKGAVSGKGLFICKPRY